MKTESIRSRKLAAQIQQELSWIVDRKIKKPFKSFITLTKVKLTSDLRLASVYFTIMGSEQEKTECRNLLNRSAAFLKYELRDKLSVRVLPDLRFFYDDTFDKSQKISELIAKIHEQDNK